MSDAYNPLENECKVTRGSLKLLHENGFGVGFSTKSDLVLRDMDILKEMKKEVPVTVKFTITAYEDELCKKIEPNVSVTSKRLDALEQLSGQGITTGVLMMPILPFIEDDVDNIRNIIKAVHQCGVRYIYPGFGVTLRQNQREHYYHKLNVLFPGLSEVYRNQYGNQYSCDSPNNKELWNVFRNECKQRKIAYRMEEIVPIIRKDYEYQQLSLFT
jgi:DNA repair photolyase